MKGAMYRHKLPQLDGSLFLTDGGIETTLIFHEGLQLPDFAAFHLFQNAEGEAALRKYFLTYAGLAKKYGAGLVLESATWRASSDWGKRLGYSKEKLAEVNRRAIGQLEGIRNEFQDAKTRIAISGCVGPRGDGYSPANMMSEKEAEAYHAEQIGTFAETAADLVTAITMNYVEEAIGAVQASRKVGMPVVISFTVETDGNLPTGQTLKDAIEQVDRTTSNAAAYYMINCAHPTHFENEVERQKAWLGRIRGVRANASRKSHVELNESPELDAGDPLEFGTQYAQLKRRLPSLNVMGGCCGTDHRHVDEIGKACLPLFT